LLCCLDGLPVTQSRSPGLSQTARSPTYALRVLTVLSALVVLGVAIGGAFFAGIRLERNASKSLVEEMRAVEEERDALSDQVASLKQQGIVLERSHQIDHEASRTLSEQLKMAQDERLALEKEVSFLRRLIREGGGGILQAKDFKLKETDEPGKFGYSFTVTQLIQDFGQSTGNIEIEVVGKRDGEETRLPLGKLKGSTPTNHEMKLKHFQNFEGYIRVPDDFDPENLIVEIKPETAGLIPVNESFPWSTE
jgi:hypothetical protein